MGELRLEDESPEATGARTESVRARPESIRARPAAARTAPPEPSPMSATAPTAATSRRPAGSPRPPSTPRSRPDPRPLRIAIGMGALATASALATALTGTGGTPAAVTAPVTLAADGTPAVQHVIQYVQLMPGQTAPPQATVQAAPTQKPRVVIVTTTRQSGAKP